MNFKCVVCLIILLCLIGCSSTKEKETPEFNFATHVINPTILLAASTCIHQYENKKWPLIREIPGDKSLFDYYSVSAIDDNNAILKFNLKYYKVDFKLELESYNYPDSMDCTGKLGSLKKSGGGDVVLPLLIETININELLWDESALDDPIVSFFFKLLLGAYVEKPNEVQASGLEQTLITLGPYITSASLCVLLAVSGASCI